MEPHRSTDQRETDKTDLKRVKEVLETCGTSGTNCGGSMHVFSHVVGVMEHDLHQLRCICIPDIRAGKSTLNGLLTEHELCCFCIPDMQESKAGPDEFPPVAERRRLFCRY